MAEGSVIIINNLVMSELGTTWEQPSMSIGMMTMLAAIERIEAHFRQLLEGPNLRLKGMGELTMMSMEARS